MRTTSKGKKQFTSWSPADTAALMDFRKDGKSFSEIARVLNRTERAVVQKYYLTEPEKKSIPNVSKQTTSTVVVSGQEIVFPSNMVVKIFQNKIYLQ